MTDGRTDVEELLQMRFVVVRLREFKSHVVNIDSRVLYAFMKEFYPVLDISNKGATGEERDTYWKKHFDSKCPKPAKKGIHGDHR